jgi:FkbM family methyltransferase
VRIVITVSVKRAGSAPGAPRPLPVLDDCPHRGPATGATVRCPTCSGTVRLKLFRCALRDECTTTTPVGQVPCCATCPQHPSRAAAHEPTVAKERGQFGAEFRAEVGRCRALAYPEGRFRGRGVVIPAGGWKMLPGVFVTASLLRWDAINSGLPIEVWHIGDEGEFDPVFSHITAGLGVTWRDVSEELRRLGIERRERLHGWAVKPLALLLSSFDQVVMLDSDCYPVVDPERLFADARIGEAPAAFWPDNAHNKWGRPLTAEQWRAFGLEPVKTPAFESGQMIVDKRKSWAAVNVAAWLSDRMDYFDATRKDTGRVRIHGDKELFSVAWNATGTPYHMAPPVRYHEVAFLQHDPDGRACFVHRCNDKPKIDFAAWKYTPQKTAGSRANFRSTTLPHEHMVHHFLDQLRELLRPTLPGFRDGTQDEQIWREVRVENVYRLPERMDGWRVLDVGAHAGFFSHECCRRGAELVFAVEPYFPNASLARVNLAPWTRRVNLIEKAIAEPGVAEVQMRGGHDPSNTGEPHVAGLVGARGAATVPAVSLDELIEQMGGRVDLLKLDCEGSEYPALLTAKRLDAVRRIAGEYHTCGLAYRPEQIRAPLEAAGFVVEMVTHTPTGMFFATRSGAGT